jgi:hypothetical protein
MFVELRLDLRPEGELAAAEPRRAALADAVRELLLPNGHVLVRLAVEGHQYAITGCQRIDSSRPAQ